MTSNHPDVSERLTHAFADWQLMYLICETDITELHTLGKATDGDLSIAQNSRRLAPTILDNEVQKLDPGGWLPNMDLIRAYESMRPLGLWYSTFANEMFLWNRMSRRVFHLPYSLQMALGSATFPDIPWKDVVWPFDSFIITLEKPIQIQEPGIPVETFDTLMVSKLPSDGVTRPIVVRAFLRPKETGKRLGLRPGEMDRIKKLQKQGRYMTIHKLLHQRRVELSRNYTSLQGSMMVYLEGVNTEGDDFIKIEPDDLYNLEFGLNEGRAPGLDWGRFKQEQGYRYESMSVFLKTAIGWMFYLETVSAKNAQWKKHERNDRPKQMSGGAPSIITEPDQICKIIGKGRMDPVKVEGEPAKRNGCGFVRPHWRRAHYKRPQGTPPGTPKTVRVPPVLVRADLVPLYGIIGGTETVVVPKE